MPIKVLMPALSPTMTEGKLASWKKKEGDSVKSGDVLAEIETDKATMEVEAIDDGKLGKILVQAGTEGVKVNEPIALILEEGEDASALASAASAAPAPAPKPASNGAGAPAPSARPTASATPPVSAAPAPAPAVSHGARVFASPLAKRMAAQAGIDLGAVAGSGPQGRVVKADIDAVIAGGGKPAARPPAPGAAPAQARAPMPQPGPTVPGSAQYKLVPHSSMRKVIARRLTESKQTVPHFYLTVDCEIDALLKLRADINKGAPEKGEGAFKLSVNDFVIKAAAIALKRVPAANASWSDEGTLLYSSADISVAVAIPGGLITPVIRAAEGKTLSVISNEMKVLAGKAKEGKLVPEEYQGGTFSISNLGMFGIKQFEAVINPPQGAILAIGAGEQRAVVKNGALAIATVMCATLSVDHRVVDGAVGAEYLAAFKKLIEEPLTMLV
jgi:pyruvate dehydrogenase E2 component (dihydrolipoamide acetyltransferase)